MKSENAILNFYVAKKDTPQIKFRQGSRYGTFQCMVLNTEFTSW